MRTVIIDGKKVSVKYKTSTGMRTLYSTPSNSHTSQFGADIYSINGDDSHFVLVGTARNGSTVHGTAVIVSADQYAEMADKYDPYDGMAYHDAVMSAIGFS